MLAKKSENWENLSTARCGRCAQILPDETLTYCLSCGIPFSRVPPTSSFHLLSEANKNSKSSSKIIWTLAILGFSLWSLSALFLELRNQALITEYMSIRPVKIYFYERKEFKSAGRALAEASAAVARQAFQDHFSFALENMRFEDESLSPEVGFLRTPLFNPDFTSLDFWARFSNEAFTSRFFRSPGQELSVLMSNFPIVAEADAREKMELRHLNPESLVSGLSHPGFVLVSSYRMLEKQSEFQKEGVNLNNFESRARFWGEYVLAHELGHSLLGLEDSVYSRPATNSFRSLASETRDVSECLMHSDEGGGFWAAAQLMKRPLGSASSCQAYSEVLEAYKLRQQSFKDLKMGKRKLAQSEHEEALRLIEGRTQPWVAAVWNKERSLFESSVHRWIRGLFMLQ